MTLVKTAGWLGNLGAGERDMGVRAFQAQALIVECHKNMSGFFCLCVVLILQTLWEHKRLLNKVWDRGPTTKMYPHHNPGASGLQLDL